VSFSFSFSLGLFLVFRTIVINNLAHPSYGCSLPRHPPFRVEPIKSRIVPVYNYCFCNPPSFANSTRTLDISPSEENFICILTLHQHICIFLFYPPPLPRPLIHSLPYYFWHAALQWLFALCATVFAFDLGCCRCVLLGLNGFFVGLAGNRYRLVLVTPTMPACSCPRSAHHLSLTPPLSPSKRIRYDMQPLNIPP